MKFSTRLFIFTFVFLLYGVASSFGQTSEKGWPMHLRIFAGPEGGQWFSISKPISDILSEEVISSTYRRGGGISNLERINSGKGDLAFSLASFLGGAASGAPEYAMIKAENVRSIGNVYPQVLYFLVRTEFAQKYNIKKVGDLLQLKAPVRFALLKKGTGSEFFVRILLKYGYDTNYAKLKENGWRIFFNNYPETADDFVAGELDCFAYTAGTHVPLLLDMENYTKFTALPVCAKVLTELKQKFKFNSYVIEPSVYKGVTKPVRTLSDFSCLVVQKDMPGDLVQAILSSLWNNKDKISETLVEFRNFSPEKALSEGIPVHQEAEKFWSNLQEQ